MRSIFVRVEPTVRLVQGAAEFDLLIVLHLLHEARLGPVNGVKGILLGNVFLK